MSRALHAKRITSLLVGAIALTVVTVLGALLWMTSEHNKQAAAISRSMVVGGIVALQEKLEKIIKEIGIAYLHAPNFHPAMKYAGPIRKELAYRTIFNCLGPLCNPAGANAQVIGLFSPALCRPFADVLHSLGSKTAFTFHGHGGMDELSITGDNHAIHLQDGKISEVTIGPATVGVAVAKPNDLLGGSPSDNAAIAREILDGKKGPRRDIVVLNVAVALVAAGLANSPEEGGKKAEAALDSGDGKKKLDALIAASQD